SHGVLCNYCDRPRSLGGLGDSRHVVSLPNSFNRVLGHHVTGRNLVFPLYPGGHLRGFPNPARPTLPKKLSRLRVDLHVVAARGDVTPTELMAALMPFAGALP